MSKKNCLSYWFPILKAAGIPVPKTEIIRLAPEMRKQIYSVFDGKQPQGCEPFFAELGDACDRMGYPAFLRTGMGSGKHNWENTCFLKCRADLENHVYALVEWSECVDFMGLDWTVWAVREMLPTKPIFVLPRYGNFPLVPEIRCFVGGGKVICIHPYWPTQAICDGFNDVPLGDAEWLAKLCQEFDVSPYLELAQQVATSFKDDEAFSVDILPTTTGLFVTDMALANESFHWPECPSVLSAELA